LKTERGREREREREITESDVEDEERVGVSDVWRTLPSEVRHVCDSELRICREWE
jgi:hypothetical protein